MLNQPLPDAAVDDYVGVIETLIQEGLTTFALPATAQDFSEVLGIFGARATFGAYRVSAVDQVSAVIDAGARFVFADFPLDDAGVVALCRDLHDRVLAIRAGEAAAVAALRDAVS